MEYFNTKSVFIFDLDDTLYLRLNRDLDYTQNYYTKVNGFLNKLKENNKKIYLLTYNADPNIYLDKININISIFNEIIKPELITIDVFEHKKDPNFKTRIVCDNTYIYNNKWYDIENLIKENNYNKEDIVFFDNDTFLVNKVKELNVDSILVDPFKGIKL